MAGISKIVDERIEQLRREKQELDEMRTRLEAWEAKLAQEAEESAQQAKFNAQQATLNAQNAAQALALSATISDIDETSEAPAKRKRGRPRKGESPNQPPEGSDLWRKAQSDVSRLRAAQFIELAEIEKQKSEQLDAMLAEKAAFMDDFAKLKIDRMRELEEYLESYRDECFAKMQADITKQREINNQRLLDELSDIFDGENEAKPT